VIIMNHGSNLTVLAKPGYWPAAMELRPRPAIRTSTGAGSRRKAGWDPDREDTGRVKDKRTR
jgi:hypothetical protein